MKGFERRSDHLRLGAYPNGRARYPVMVWRADEVEPLAIDDMNLSAEKERQALLDCLPGDVRDEAEVLSRQVAADVIRSRGEQMAPDTICGGGALVLRTPTPAVTQVDGQDLLSELAATTRRYVVLPPSGAESVALWVMHAYAHDASHVSPILAVTSPEKRCGKTTLLEVLACLVPRALPTANISVAAVFRTIEALRPTLLIDEMDTVFHPGAGREELRGILNSGHRRTTAAVVRIVGEHFEPRMFSTWCPKVLAKIGEFPDTLADRSITLRLHRKTGSERVERLCMERTDPALEPLRARCARWAADHLAELRDAEPLVPPGLHDRAADNWRPLFAIADVVGGTWQDLARHSAATLSGVTSEPAQRTKQVSLLKDVHALFAEKDQERVPTAVLISWLNALEQADWSGWNNGKGISPTQVANLLQPFGIEPKSLRFRQRVLHGYERHSFLEAFSRYLPSC